MDKNKNEKSKNHEEGDLTSKITAVDFYTIAFTILQLYLLKLSLTSFTWYLSFYFPENSITSHIVAFLNGLNLFLLLVNLIGIGLIVRAEDYKERKNMMVGVFSMSVFIIFIYIVIELLSARIPY